MATTATSRAVPTRWRLPLILGSLGVLVGLSFLTNAGVTSVGFDVGLGFYWLVAGVIAGVAIGVVLALLAAGRSGDERRTRSRAQGADREKPGRVRIRVG